MLERKPNCVFCNLPVEKPGGQKGRSPDNRQQNGPGLSGIMFQAMGTEPPGNAGAYTWIQLVNRIRSQASTSMAPVNAPGLPRQPRSIMPTQYNNVYTTNTYDDTAIDTPTITVPRHNSVHL
jgi:hypothetical protein